jgi:secondary thiamine-phosphate synthase enzyme
LKVHQDTIEIETRGDRDMTDITGKVERIVAEANVEKGLCNVFNVGSTATVGTIEFEPGLADDFPETMERIIPPSRSYGHELAWHDGNGHSHLQASILGPGTTIPIENGSLASGVWQQIFHYEADVKPRRRRVVVTVIGETKKQDGETT